MLTMAAWVLATGVVLSQLGCREQPVSETRASAAQGAATNEEVKDMARQGRYTKRLVNQAISLYRREGLPAAIAHYSDPESIEGQWYIFILSDDGEVLAHPDEGRTGLNVKDWVGTDANGYPYGSELLKASPHGHWVSYVYGNPANGSLDSPAFGNLELKNSWAVREGGLIFVSGWYIDADSLTGQLVEDAAEEYRRSGLEATTVRFNDASGFAAGLRETVEYYNGIPQLEGRWGAYIANRSGRVVAHTDSELVGGPLNELLGDVAFQADRLGKWFEGEYVRVYMVTEGGLTFGAGWHK